MATTSTDAIPQDLDTDDETDPVPGEYIAVEVADAVVVADKIEIPEAQYSEPAPAPTEEDPQIPEGPADALKDGGEAGTSRIRRSTLVSSGPCQVCRKPGISRSLTPHRTSNYMLIQYTGAADAISLGTALWSTSKRTGKSTVTNVHCGLKQLTHSMMTWLLMMA